MPYIELVDTYIYNSCSEKKRKFCHSITLLNASDWEEYRVVCVLIESERELD